MVEMSPRLQRTQDGALAETLHSDEYGSYAQGFPAVEHGISSPTGLVQWAPQAVTANTREHSSVSGTA